MGIDILVITLLRNNIITNFNKSHWSETHEVGDVIFNGHLK